MKSGDKMKHAEAVEEIAMIGSIAFVVIGFIVAFCGFFFRVMEITYIAIPFVTIGVVGVFGLMAWELFKSGREAAKALRK